MVVEEEIVEIAQSIWISILDLNIDVDDEQARSLESDGERTLTGCVHLTGDWEGAVLLYCTEPFARRAAAIMFAMEARDLSDEEVQDALGELANMTAGNIKSLLPGASRLSLPSVVQGLDYSMIVPGSRRLCQVNLRCDKEPLVITLVQRSNAAHRQEG